MKGTAVFLLFIAVAFPVSAQLEFLAPSTGKKLFYEVEYTSPMGNGEFYLTMISGNKAGNMVCDITFYADSLFSEKYSVSSVTYRDSADFYQIQIPLAVPQLGVGERVEHLPILLFHHRQRAQ